MQTHDILHRNASDGINKRLDDFLGSDVQAYSAALASLAAGGYTESTFTPALAFGGGTTGITYGTQTGEYTKIGNTVFVHTIKIVLTSKGSSTGASTITGLPFTPAGAGAAAFGYYASFTTLGGGPPVIILDANAAGCRLYNAGATGSVALTDADFSNTTDIRGSFIYRV